MIFPQIPVTWFRRGICRVSNVSSKSFQISTSKYRFSFKDMDLSKMLDLRTFQITYKLMHISSNLWCCYLLHLHVVCLGWNCTRSLWPHTLLDEFIVQPHRPPGTAETTKRAPKSNGKSLLNMQLTPSSTLTVARKPNFPPFSWLARIWN